MTFNALKFATASLDHIKARAKILAREDRLMRTELADIRRANNLTQKDVAELMGVTQQAVNKLERYDADPKLSTLRRYANAVGAIVEHRVTPDRGQSLTTQARTNWESSSRAAWMDNIIVFPTSRVSGHWAHQPEWSAEERTNFALTA